MNQATHPWSEPDPEAAEAPGAAAQWFGLLGGVTAYAAHLVVGVPLVAVACSIGSTWPIHLLTVAMTLVILASLSTAWWMRQRTREADEADEGPGSDHPDHARAVGAADAPGEVEVDPPGTTQVGARRRVRYLANLGLLLNPVALLIVVATEINVHVYDPCLPGHIG